jgi:hypothetical protein
MKIAHTLPSPHNGLSVILFVPIVLIVQFIFLTIEGLFARNTVRRVTELRF